MKVDDKAEWYIQGLHRAHLLQHLAIAKLALIVSIPGYRAS